MKCSFLLLFKLTMQNRWFLKRSITPLKQREEEGFAATEIYSMSVAISTLLHCILNLVNLYVFTSILLLLLVLLFFFFSEFDQYSFTNAFLKILEDSENYTDCKKTRKTIESNQSPHRLIFGPDSRAKLPLLSIFKGIFAFAAMSDTYVVQCTTY